MLKIKATKWLALCVVVALVSLMGFCVENIWLAITKGFIDNRNMNLPFLLGYGLAIATVYILFGTPGELLIFGMQSKIKNKTANKLIFFIIMFCCVSIGEILLGTLVEKLCGFYWWDYSRLPLHITRYTSVPTSLGFASLMYILMEYIFTPLYSYIMNWDFNFLQVISPILMISLSLDFFHSAYYMYKNKKMMPKWKVTFRHTPSYILSVRH